MPRLYLTPTELSAMPLALNSQMQTFLAQLPPGSIDTLLFRASVMCDAYCKKRLQAPGTSTLSASASAGATSISVASTLTLDDLAEQAVIINPGGGNQETVIIQPGGVATTLTAGVLVSPYPGTIALAAGLVNGHSSGEPVQYCYKETTEAGSSSSSDPYTESLQTQTMQLALAHLPPARQALTRVVFLKNYPIITIANIEHAFSFVNQFNEVDMTIETIVPNEGWYRFNVGTVILREGIMRTTYTGGYQVIPDDVKSACSYYFAEQMLQMLNPFGLASIGMGKRNQRWDTSKGSELAASAEDKLSRYRRTV